MRYKIRPVDDGAKVYHGKLHAVVSAEGQILRGEMPRVDHWPQVKAAAVEAIRSGEARNIELSDEWEDEDYEDDTPELAEASTGRAPCPRCGTWCEGDCEAN